MGKEKREKGKIRKPEPVMVSGFFATILFKPFFLFMFPLRFR